MADYISAFRQGLDAAEAAEIAKLEIDSVFDEIDKQLREASNGKIGIDRKEFYVKEESIPPFAAAFIATIPYALTGKKRDTYWAIVAYNPSIPNSPVKELATWSLDRAGYPCKLTFEGINRSCSDRESLENSLAELLRDPNVGEKLSNLIKLELPVQEATEVLAQQTDTAEQ